MDNNTHDYKDTIKEAAEVPSERDEHALERSRHADSEAAYETLAINCSMGMLGMEPTTASLIQLELAQELLYKFDEQSHSNDVNEDKTED